MHDVGTLGSLRERNRHSVIGALQRRGVASRPELARLTGLSRTTVASLVAELQREGLVIERAGTSEDVHGSGGGRPPILVALDRSAGAAVGIDFGHTHVRVGVADLSHTLLAERTQQLDVDQRAAEGLDLATDLVAAVLADAGVERGRVLGVGMGLPGPISRESGMVGSSSILPGWVGIETAREMGGRLGLPVRVDNDANLGALAEATFGAARSRTDIAYLKVSSGIGAGLIVEGRLYHGATGIAGEIGHVRAVGDGRVCRCGSAGCLETVAAAPRVAEQLQHVHGSDLSVERLLGLAADGDLAARRAIADAGRHIGTALAALCNLLNPELVVVGGDLSIAGELLLDPLRESLRRAALPAAAERVEIVAGQLGERAEVLGALALVLKESELAIAAPAGGPGA